MGKAIVQKLGFDGLLINVVDIPKLYPNYMDVIGIGADSIYFSGGKPTVLFLHVGSFDESTLKLITKVQHNAWNYQRILFLYVVSDTEIRIYNCFAKPINTNSKEECDKKLLPIQLVAYTLEDDLSSLLYIFSRINVDSGTIWTSENEVRDRIRKDCRVDAYLIRCMVEAARRLGESGLSQDVIHSLLIRSLFILFLEDRGAADEAGLYETIKPGVKTYFKLLGDKEATYRLFNKLHEQFNGNITAMVPNEEDFVKEEHLSIIHDCFFDGNFDHQPKLFERERLFNFKIIHIGLISEIYENFLGEMRRKKGQFYTPFTLVDMILSEVLPTSINNYNYPLLDSACGSGIFLVEGYKRLIKRWKLAHNKHTIPFETLVSILKDNIYGIEVDKTAIRVAAFSLYLTLIDELDPKTLWNSKTHKLPYLIHDPCDDTLKGRQGKNLWCRNTISEIDVESFPKVQLVVGNPPYGKKDLPEEIKKYCNKEHFAHEYVLPFMHKATQFCPEGQIALVFSSKVLFNTQSGYAHFRKWLFSDNTVQKIDNLSVFRKSPTSFGGSLFAEATCPVCVAYYSAGQSSSHSTITYRAPKSFIKSNLIDGLQFDESDIKLLPIKECQNPYTKIWKVAFWGNYYGFQLINRLSKKTLLQYFIEKKWIFGRGLNADSQRQEFIPSPILDTTHISRYRTDVAAAKQNLTRKYRRTQAGLFDPPVVVFKQGQHDGEVACSLFMEKAFFTTTAHAINCIGGNIDEKKILTAYLNSKLAKYFLFLTTSSWGVEREQIYLNEVLGLPSPFEGLTVKAKKTIVKCFDELYILSGEVLADTIRMNELEAAIEVEFEKAFHLSERDCIYVNDTLDFFFGIFQKGFDARGYHRVLPEESNQYAKILVKSMETLLAGVDIKAKAIIFNPTINDPLQLVILELADEQAVVKETLLNYRESLCKIDDYLWKRKSESIYLRRILKYYDKNRVYLIKPNQKRFWSKMQAYEDAAAIVNDILNVS